MRNKILTIAILSYKRPKFLDTLLSNIVSHIDKLKISDLTNITVRVNPCNGYDYKNIYKKYKNFDYIFIIENEINVGAVESWCRTIETIETKYFWQLGDDDDIDINALKIFFDSLNSNYDFMIFNYTNYKITKDNKVIKKKIMKNEFNRLIQNPYYLIDKYSIHLGLLSCFLIKTDLYKKIFHKIEDIASSNNLDKSNLKPLLILIYTLSSGYKGYLVGESHVKAFHPGEIASIDSDRGPLTKFLIENRLWVSYFMRLYENKDKNIIKNFIIKGFIKEFFLKTIVTTYNNDFNYFINQLKFLFRNQLLYKFAILFLIIYRFVIRNLIIIFKKFGFLKNIRFLK